MINLNKNHSINTLQEIVRKNMNQRLDYMPDSFNKEQQYALELFQKRLYLEEIIEETISFNRNLSWDDINKSLKLTTSAEELIKVFEFRSDVYTEIGYQNEFPDVIEGLNFDIFDKSAGIVYYQNNKVVTGSCRLIFDSKNKLPSEDKYSFNNLRDEYGILGEISRNAVRNNTKKGLGLEFKYLMAGMYNVFINNNIDLTLSVMKKEHYKLFSKFGGNDVVDELCDYGELKQTSLIISWDPSKVSNFFKKVFLK